MLKIAGLVVAGLVVLVLVLVVWLYLRAFIGGRKAYAALAARIAPVTQALARGEEPSATLLNRYAEDRETRKVLFEALASANRSELFPAKYLTWESLAEADLVAWLCHPNELGAPPSELELVARLPPPDAPSPDLAYFLFRYRMHEPHWAAKDGWLAGVAGPYATAGAPACSAAGTFSRFEAFDSRTPEEHVAIAHATVLGKSEEGHPANDPM